MKVDFTKFEHSLPYASELYGIYQPLLGWRSRVRTLELAEGVSSLKGSYLQELQVNTTPLYTLPATGVPRNVPAGRFKVSVGERAGTGRSALDAVDSIVARKVGKLVAEAGFGEAAWHKYTSADALEEILAASQDDIQAELGQVITVRHGVPNLTVMQTGLEADVDAVLSGILERESTVAGALRRLGEERSPSEIAELMRPSVVPSETPFFLLLNLVTPAAHSDLFNATISPIGLVRLYRQYFFEFDTFLGPPVQHLWLSPGGVVELVEVSTRRTLVERTIEQAFESIEKSENSLSDQDELSKAVRSENSANTKLGVTLSSTGSYGVGFVSGSTTVGSSFNVEQSSKEAREETHRSLRQQTEKLSSEIRKSFKSAFKTVTETTDIQSRRYVINNTTKDLINYELRRKMRQVGVQVQDYGLHLCWQTYVDKPGDELGIAPNSSTSPPQRTSRGSRSPTKPRCLTPRSRTHQRA